MLISSIQSAETTSALVYSTLITAKQSLTPCSNFNKMWEENLVLTKMAWPCMELTTQDIYLINSRLLGCWPESTRRQEGRNRQNDPHECYSVCTVRVFIISRICPKPGGMTIIWYQLHQAERCNTGGRLPRPMDGPGPFRRIVHVLADWHQFWRLTSLDWRLVQGQNDVLITPWTVQIFTNSVQSKARIEHVPGRDRHYTLNGQVDVYGSIHIRCCHLLDVRQTTSRPHMRCTGTTVRSWSVIETE